MGVETEISDEEKSLMTEVDQLFAQFPEDSDFDEGCAKLIDMMRERFVRLLKQDRFSKVLCGTIGISPDDVDNAMCTILKESSLSYRFWDSCVWKELHFVNERLKWEFIKKHVIFFYIIIF